MTFESESRNTESVDWSLSIIVVKHGLGGSVWRKLCRFSSSFRVNVVVCALVLGSLSRHGEEVEGGLNQRFVSQRTIL